MARGVYVVRTRPGDICPAVFDLDDEGHAVVLVAEVPSGLEQKARDAARNCPERAIALG